MESPEFLPRPIGGYWVWVFVSLALLSSLLLLRAVVGRVGRPRAVVLAGLRFCALIVALFIMLRPMLVYTSIEKQPATFVLVVDTSRSMEVRDVVGGRSRWEAVREQLDATLPTLKKLQEDLDIKIATFDSETRIVAFDGEQLELPESAAGDESAIGQALGDILRDTTGQTLAGVVLLSDGVQQALPVHNDPPQGYARRLKQLGAELYTVAFGNTSLGDMADLMVHDLKVNSTVFVKNQLSVAAEVRVLGYANKPLTVELLFENPSGEMVVVDTLQVQSRGSEERIPVELSHIPELPGEYKLSVRVQPMEGELVQTNNEVSDFVSVLKGGLNVLHLYGSILPEQKFLRWSLGSSENIQLDGYWIHPRDPDPLGVLPPEVFEPGSYDVILLSDVRRDAFSDEQLDKLDSLIRDSGAGLMMTGGLFSFGPGGWYLMGPQTRFERQNNPRETADYRGLLPVAMSRNEQQQRNGPVRRDVHLGGLQKMVPTPTGLRHFVMLLGSQQTNQQVWEELPELQGANKFDEISASAQVLARNASDDPLLVAHDVGAGRVMAFAGDSTHLWWMRGHQEEHRRFWRQCILWLAHKEDDNDSDLRIALTKRRLLPTESVDAYLSARTPEGEPIPNAQMKAEVLFPDGTTRALPLSQQGNRKIGTILETVAPGDYTVKAEATYPDGTLVGTAEARFLVEDRDLELDNPQADLALLDRLARITGGERITYERLPGLMEDLANRGLNNEIERYTKLDLWDNWVIIGLFVGLLSTEWYLRKRWALV